MKMGRQLFAVSLLLLGTLVPIVHAEPSAYEQYDTAIDRYSKAANQGDLESQAQLGLLYMKGRGPGASQDYASAEKWLRTAAERGHVKAQVALGDLIIRQSDVQHPAYAAALPWYRKAAEAGEPSAQRRLGVMVLAGQGVPANESEGFQWLQKSAAAGDSEAKRALISCYLQGRGTPINPELAEQMIQEAAKSTDTDTLRQLAFMFLEGKGVARDRYEAHRLLQRAIDLGDPYARGSLIALERDMTVEQRLFARAFSRGTSSESQLDRGMVGKEMPPLRAGMDVIREWPALSSGADRFGWFYVHEGKRHWLLLRRAMPNRADRWQVRAAIRLPDTRATHTLETDCWAESGTFENQFVMLRGPITPAAWQLNTGQGTIAPIDPASIYCGQRAISARAEVARPVTGPPQALLQTYDPQEMVNYQLTLTSDGTLMMTDLNTGTTAQSHIAPEKATELLATIRTLNYFSPQTHGDLDLCDSPSKGPTYSLLVRMDSLEKVVMRYGCSGGGSERLDRWVGEFLKAASIRPWIHERHQAHPDGYYWTGQGPVWIDIASQPIERLEGILIAPHHPADGPTFQYRYRDRGVEYQPFFPLKHYSSASTILVDKNGKSLRWDALRASDKVIVRRYWKDPVLHLGGVFQILSIQDLSKPETQTKGGTNRD